MPAPLPVNWSAIAALAVAGATLEQLSKQTGIKLSTLKARSSRGGWKRAVKAQDAAKAEVATLKKQMKPVATDGLAIAKGTLADDDRETRISLSRSLRRGAKHAENMEGVDVLKNARNVHELIKGAGHVHGWTDSKADVLRIDIYSNSTEKVAKVIELEEQE